MRYLEISLENEEDMGTDLAMAILIDGIMKDRKERGIPVFPSVRYVPPSLKSQKFIHTDSEKKSKDCVIM